MTRTRQTKGSTSSKFSPCCLFLSHRQQKMQETRYNMPSTLEQRGGN